MGTSYYLLRASQPNGSVGQITAIRHGCGHQNLAKLCSSAFKPHLLYSDFFPCDFFFLQRILVACLFQKRRISYLLLFSISFQFPVCRDTTVRGGSRKFFFIVDTVTFLLPWEDEYSREWRSHHQPTQLVCSIQFRDLLMTVYLLSMAQMHFHCGRYFLCIGGQIYYLHNKRGIPVSRLQHI